MHRSVYLTGATASGKTAVGVALAQHLDAEVIALDSMTLYRGMDIGTAKPTLDEREGVPHHLIDVLDPWQSASVADYRGWALQTAAEIEGRGKRILFVGGTALYLKALLRGLFEGPAADTALRQELEAEADRRGPEALHARLETLDPRSAARLHPNDRRRLVRALEVLALTGRRLSDLQTEHEQPAPDDVAVFALQRPRPEMHDRINRRVVAMFREGFVEEVRRLRESDPPISPVAAQGVGYLEVLEHLETGIPLERTISLIQARTRQFAKRQETWFRGLSEVKPWPVATSEPPGVTARALADRISSGN
ncbi:tRNA (adenosine(37)-N6)-dimethylallyltransferase MiaA [Singulisphaera sp. PoT]|uniref:tRNA (adenosine(37)-N6)-dimethylallyltransferase MiaA n=1 Tax=Singulisphaera sp. PoT TaxID=3411797 RepID=UPI003BF59C7C